MDTRLKRLDPRTALSAIADIVMPRVCVVCGAPLIMQEKHICSGCLVDMPLTHFSKSRHNEMADKFNALIEADRYCNAAALYFYGEESGYRNISQALKYHRNFSAGWYFSEMLGKELSESEIFRDVDLVVPVPLHWTREFKRGYNQSDYIGRAVAKKLGSEYRKDYLVRTKRTKTQTKVDPEEKSQNVAGAFKAKEWKKEKRPGHILIVDDVYTTGATLAECYKAIRKEAGSGVRISIATLAYVGR